MHPDITIFYNFTCKQTGLTHRPLGVIPKLLLNTDYMVGKILPAWKFPCLKTTRIYPLFSGIANFEKVVLLDFGSRRAHVAIPRVFRFEH